MKYLIFLLLLLIGCGSGPVEYKIIIKDKSVEADGGCKYSLEIPHSTFSLPYLITSCTDFSIGDVLNEDAAEVESIGPIILHSEEPDTLTIKEKVQVQVIKEAMDLDGVSKYFAESGWETLQEE